MKNILIIALLILGIFNVPVFGMVAYVEVIDQAGSYIVQIYSGNTIMTGEFEVE